MSVSANNVLLKLVNKRSDKKTSFDRGITTADRYVKTLEECAGTDLCYRYAAKGSVSFADLTKRAKRTLTYSNDDMVLEDFYTKSKNNTLEIAGESLELPKNTLMVFRHVLTSPRKDRDGDILRTKGALVDPKLPLLWQHVHTLPIGKMLAIAEHTPNKLSLITAIIDLNELSHDAAVMVDNGMGRFSHGFRALEFSKLKEGSSDDDVGFDVKKFEIMEESLVSVPSNVDANEEEILLSLIEGGKMTSAMMKETGRYLRKHRPSQSGWTPESEDDDAKAKTCPCQQGGEGSPKQEGDKPCSCGGKKPAENSEDEEVKEESGKTDKTEKCPKCGGAMEKGSCTKCGYNKSESEESEDKEKGLAETDWISAESAMAIFLAKGTMQDYGNMAQAIKAIVEAEQRSATTREIRELGLL